MLRKLTKRAHDFTCLWNIIYIGFLFSANLLRWWKGHQLQRQKFNSMPFLNSCCRFCQDDTRLLPRICIQNLSQPEIKVNRGTWADLRVRVSYWWQSRLNIAVQWLAPLLCRPIREFQGSKFIPKTGCSEWESSWLPQSFQKISGTVGLT
jgi:hypothetical protein